MDYKKAIQKDGTIDLTQFPHYTIKFTKRSEVMEVYGYNVVIPEAPCDEDCINYGLSIDEQYFRKTHIPKDLNKWDEKKRDSFIDGEYNRRINGCFIFIKGKKYYITGVFYFFLNYWTSSASNRIDYRFTDLQFFLVWMHCVLDPNCYGMVLFKSRQIGATEKAICILYEYATRVKKARCPMQSISEDDIYENAYKRILHAHGEMTFYMRATNRGTSDPKDGLFFDYQRETLSKDKMRKNQEEQGVANLVYEDYMYSPLDSAIVYGATKPHVFGTGTFGRYYMDEFGKMEAMNALSAWGVVREAMYNRILGEILGKAILTSTVEDLKGGDTLRVAKQFWNQSDPEKINENGQTLTGLYRVFIGALEGEKPDKWGFAPKEETEKRIKATLKSYMEMGDIKGMIEFKRKNAINIDDVFQSTNEGSQFDIDKLSSRLFNLENTYAKKPYVRGNFKWKDGIKDTQVIWEPNSRGRWLVSGHPEDFGVRSNDRVLGVIASKPGNTKVFKAGVDPIDQETTLEAEPSLGAIAVKAMLNEFVDGGTDKYYQFTDESRGIRMGDPVDGGLNFTTNRFVCTYLFRPSDPVDFFEDVIMTMVYYGTDFLPEKDRFGGLHTHLKNRGYELYLMEKPTNFKNVKGQSEQHGVSATRGNINTYFEYLTTLSCKWANTIDHPDLLEQLLSMNYGNRGKKDLGVAAGWCEYACAQPRMKYSRPEQQKVVHWEENYV